MKACSRRQEPKLILVNQSVLFWVTSAVVLQLFVSTLIEGFTPPLRLATTKALSHPLRSTAENTPVTDLAVETTVQVCGSKDCTRRGGGARLEKTIREVGLISAPCVTYLR
jgi:hypothetical protein